MVNNRFFLVSMITLGAIFIGTVIVLAIMWTSAAKENDTGMTATATSGGHGALIVGTVDNFTPQVLQSSEPVLVDFWAAWCGPCRMIAPTVEDIANNETGIRVVKVNIDEQSSLAKQYNVSSIPTLIVFRGGKEVNRTVGVVSREALIAKIAEAR